MTLAVTAQGVPGPDMDIDGPRQPAAGAACCATVLPACNSPEIPSLRALMDTPLSDMDEDLFQETLHALPSPLGPVATQALKGGISAAGAASAQGAVVRAAPPSILTASQSNWPLQVDPAQHDSLQQRKEHKLQVEVQHTPVKRTAAQPMCADSSPSCFLDSMLPDDPLFSGIGATVSLSGELDPLDLPWSTDNSTPSAVMPSPTVPATAATGASAAAATKSSSAGLGALRIGSKCPAGAQHAAAGSRCSLLLRGSPTPGPAMEPLAAAADGTGTGSCCGSSSTSLLGSTGCLFGPGAAVGTGGMDIRLDLMQLQEPWIGSMQHGLQGTEAGAGAAWVPSASHHTGPVDPSLMLTFGLQAVGVDALWQQPPVGCSGAGHQLLGVTSSGAAALPGPAVWRSTALGDPGAAEATVQQPATGHGLAPRGFLHLLNSNDEGAFDADAQAAAASAGHEATGPSRRKQVPVPLQPARKRRGGGDRRLPKGVPRSQLVGIGGPSSGPLAEPVLFINLPYKPRTSKRPRPDSATEQEGPAKKGPAADAAGGAAAAAGAAAVAAAAGDAGGGGGGSTTTPAAAAAGTAAAPAKPKAAGRARSRAQLQKQERAPPPVKTATLDNKKKALVGIVKSMLETSAMRKKALNLVHQIDKFATAGAELPKPASDVVEDLAKCTTAICCSLPSKMLLESQAITRQIKKNPNMYSNGQDNFGYHPGHVGWIQCRKPGSAPEEEPAARKAAMAAANQEALMADRFKTRIIDCGDDVVEAAAAAKEMLQEMKAVSLAGAQQRQEWREAMPCSAVSGRVPAAATATAASAHAKAELCNAGDGISGDFSAGTMQQMQAAAAAAAAGVAGLEPPLLPGGANCAGFEAYLLPRLQGLQLDMLQPSCQGLPLLTAEHLQQLQQQQQQLMVRMAAQAEGSPPVSAAAGVAPPVSMLHDAKFAADGPGSSFSTGYEDPPTAGQQEGGTAAGQIAGSSTAGPTQAAGAAAGGAVQAQQGKSAAARGGQQGGSDGCGDSDDGEGNGGRPPSGGLGPTGHAVDAAEQAATEAGAGGAAAQSAVLSASATAPGVSGEEVDGAAAAAGIAGATQANSSGSEAGPSAQAGCAGAAAAAAATVAEQSAMVGAVPAGSAAPPAAAAAWHGSIAPPIDVQLAAALAAGSTPELLQQQQLLLPVSAGYAPLDDSMQAPIHLGDMAAGPSDGDAMQLQQAMLQLQLQQQQQQQHVLLLQQQQQQQLPTGGMNTALALQHQLAGLPLGYYWHGPGIHPAQQQQQTAVGYDAVCGWPPPVHIQGMSAAAYEHEVPFINTGTSAAASAAAAVAAAAAAAVGVTGGSSGAAADAGVQPAAPCQAPQPRDGSDAAALRQAACTAAAAAGAAPNSVVAGGGVAACVPGLSGSADSLAADPAEGDGSQPGRQYAPTKAEAKRSRARISRAAINAAAAAVMAAEGTRQPPAEPAAAVRARGSKAKPRAASRTPSAGATSVRGKSSKTPGKAPAAAGAAAQGRPKRARKPTAKLADCIELAAAASDEIADPGELEQDASWEQADSDADASTCPMDESNDECGEIDDDKLLELLCLDDKNKVYVVRSKAAAGDSTPRVISQEILKRLYHLPTKEAAEKLKIGTTVLKKYARQFGIERWPARIIGSIQRLIDQVTAFQESSMAAEDANTEATLAKLRQEMANVYADPNKELAAPIKKLREAVNKLMHKDKKRSQAVRSTSPTAQAASQAGADEAEGMH